MTVTELSFWNYTAKSRSGVVHVMVSYIIKNFYMIYWIPCLYEMKIKVWNAAEIGFFILTSCVLFRGGWWLQLSFMLSPFFSLYDQKKQHFIHAHILNDQKRVCFFPSFSVFPVWGDRNATSASFLEFDPKVFFFFPSRLQGEVKWVPPPLPTLSDFLFSD